METSTTMPTAAAEATQPEATEGQTQPGVSQEKAQAKAGATLEKSEKLRQLLQREKKDPEAAYSFTKEENELYDAYVDGKLKPAKKTKAQKPEPEEPTETEAPEEVRVSEPEEDAEETEADTEDTEEDDGEDESDPEADALMKEVGAKSLKEALAKVKELRSKLGGKDAQANAQLAKQVQNEKALWEDVARGVPAAIAHAERAYGIKVGPAQAQASQSQQPAKEAQGGRGYISEDAFIEPESAKMVNDILRQRDAELDEMREVAKSFKEERERSRRDSATQAAKHNVIDEMVQVAQGMPALKAIGNLREAIANWYDRGQPDSRLESFNELFLIARDEGCSLKAAATIKRGMESDLLIAQAEERGRKAAYGHKTNPSLSGQQGGRNEQGNYSPITDAQLEAMSEDHKLIPDDWFDKNDVLDKSKIPRKAWRAFGFV